jgi:hypothetical protein
VPKLTFSDFAKLLSPIIGGGKKTSDFVLFLIEQIMEVPFTEADKRKAEECQYNPLAALDISTLEKIYNGTRAMSKKNAEAVLAHVDKDGFSGYLSTLSNDVIDLVGDALRSNGIAIVDSDVIATCADLFVSVLSECAGKADWGALKQQQQLNLFEIAAEPAPALMHFPVGIPNSDMYLLMEAGGVCPLCRKSLIGEKDADDAVSLYRVVSVYPKNADQLGDAVVTPINLTARDNCAVLCLDHANAYETNTTRNDYLRLRAAKETLRRNYLAQDTTDRMFLEGQIAVVIRRIAAAGVSDLTEELSMNALCIADKITNDNVPLITKTKSYAVSYYNFIKAVFSGLEREGKLSFDDVAQDVQSCYKKLLSRNLTQGEIFTQITNWFKGKANSNDDLACEIIAAFFVQNCEVFHAITQ